MPIESKNYTENAKVMLIQRNLHYHVSKKAKVELSEHNLSIST